MLKGLLLAQCIVALFVIAADLPPGFLRGLADGAPSSLPMDTPVQPGNQTRQFDPSRVRLDLPTGPGFPADEAVPPRLEFTSTTTGGRDGAVLLNGTIADGDADRFADWLKGLDALPSEFVLNSPGGEVGNALQIGRMIRETGLPVVITEGGFCFSACPYILAGGQQREVSRQAFVGVHQHYFGENTLLPAFLLVSDIQAGQGEVMAYLAEMGIDPMLMAKALITPPDDIYILLSEELMTFRLSTRLTE